MISTLTRSTTAEPGTAFKNLITEPLESVLGQPLLSVSYWLLNYGWETVPVEQPNVFGLLFVELYFGNDALDISWGFDKSLRGDDLAYHVQVLPAGQTHKIAPEDAGNYCEVANVDALPWQEVIGQRLTAVEVFGLQGSPQAIRFSFSGTDVVIAIGYAGNEDDVAICDGDDVLVFSGQEWNSQKNSYESMWTSKIS